MVRLGLPKIQFPSPSRCPACRAPSGKWREPLLLRHLRATYCIEARPGSPCYDAADLPRGSGSGSGLRLGKLEGGADEGAEGAEGGAEEDVLPLPAVALGCLVAVALLVALHRRTRRAETHQPNAMLMTPVNDYSWDGEGSDGERTGSHCNSTLPLLHRKLQDFPD